MYNMGDPIGLKKTWVPVASPLLMTLFYLSLQITFLYLKHQQYWFKITLNVMHDVFRYYVVHDLNVFYLVWYLPGKYYVKIVLTSKFTQLSY